MARETPRRRGDIDAGAVPAEELRRPFPRLSLPIRPPFPPMEAELVGEIPEAGEWLYEPKWDGFRCLAFKEGATVVLQSKSGQPLGRYFPELVRAVSAIRAPRIVLDGEIIIASGGRLSFDDLLQRIHPAESRVARLSKETPANYLVFDLLVDPRGRSLVERPLSDRRKLLERFFERLPPGGDIHLSPADPDRRTAVKWMKELAPSGFDGVIAKRLEAGYRSGDRTGMVKIKRMRTADCVVGGFRYDQNGREIGSLLLGLYDAEGRLDHVGFTSSFTAEERRALKDVVLPLRGPTGFTGKAPGGLSRWSTRRSMEWESLKPTLVCEVKYDHFSGDRFRHGTKFLRWRPDKSPKSCTFEQLGASASSPPPFDFLRGKKAVPE
jgi:ATP-dependent DNA ligase